MVIRFLCPGGHKIRCEEEQAGREAKCPHCGVRFRVPSAGAAKDLQVEKIEGMAASEPESDESSGSSAKIPSPEKDGASFRKHKEPQIEFLCPNGHKLNGPASLQGRAGQCPECGAKFRIPTYNQEEAEEPVADMPQFPDFTHREDPEQEESQRWVKESSASHTFDPLPLPIADNSLAEILAPSANTPQGWEALVVALLPYKSAGVVVEILLSNGDKIVPDRYSSAFSAQGYGLFAARDASSTQTITAVAWSSVSQIAVRGLKHLPEELFE